MPSCGFVAQVVSAVVAAVVALYLGPQVCYFYLLMTYSFCRFSKHISSLYPSGVTVAWLFGWVWLFLVSFVATF